jgi:O-antigen/teichoic acid export membrane protein
MLREPNLQNHDKRRFRLMTATIAAGRLRPTRVSTRSSMNARWTLAGLFRKSLQFLVGFARSGGPKDGQSSLNVDLDDKADRNSKSISAVSPMRWTFLSAIVSGSAMALQLAVVSRFLSAPQLGLAALATMILGFATVIADFGINKVLIKEQNDLAPGLRTPLYLLELVLAFAVWILVWISSPSLAYYYAAPELSPLLRQGSLCLLIVPIGHQFYCLLSRDLLFKTLATIEIVSSVIGLAIAVLAAILNAGAYAPVWGWAGILAIKYLLIAIVGWRQYPLRLAWKVQGLLPHLKFAFYATVENIISFISINIDYLVIGFYLGPQELGYYTLAYQVATFAPQKIAPVLTRVAFPMFAKQQANNSVLCASYLNFSQLATILTLPLLVGVLITAPLLVRVVFGIAWERSIAIIQLLTIFGIGRMVIIPVVPLLLAKGRADLAFASGALFTLITLIVFWLIVEMGLQAVAGSFAVISICYAVFMLAVARWTIGLSLWTYLLSIRTTVVATFWMSIAAYLALAQTIISIPSAARLLVAVFIGGITYATYILVADRRIALNIRSLLTGQTDRPGVSMSGDATPPANPANNSTASPARP